MHCRCPELTFVMQIPVVHFFKNLFTGLLLLNLVACASLGSQGDPRDPFEGLNRGVYSFNEALDKTLINHLVGFYRAITPDVVDQGISNMFSNVNDLIVVVNDILQFKIKQALSDIARIVFNSTLGIGGFFDVSTEIGFPKHDEDFGQTLATWGLGPGPYLVVPILGPSTLRDAVGYAVATTTVSPLSYIQDTGQYVGVLSLNYVDFKADLLSAERLIGEAAVDEYEFTKNAYLERRDNLIHDRPDGSADYEDLDL